MEAIKAWFGCCLGAHRTNRAPEQAEPTEQTPLLRETPPPIAVGDAILFPASVIDDILQTLRNNTLTVDVNAKSWSQLTPPAISRDGTDVTREVHVRPLRLIAPTNDT
ncbi:hypothetical protein MVES_000954 [Malassezia vespertilionis]|uniref:Uncharacterized protein n=1 Tax=Malassezia vespertilionis TaxID=2020962 RepID=A0A2N1JFG1_9BASI|nr:hypothetical protein MVES_000954 [Malassezia vespertilionis]